ncbi:N-acetyltransferase [Tindallia magadiensis]|uniref:N-acetyltransferase n=1 Tax=Tindallia magadiensis TaxID=69895 RepID=UPI000B81A099|nr:N-acetyltransferase [Tindallia magadiensis]
MIKNLEVSRIEDVMKIWLEVNIDAHDFISEEYWNTNYDFVKQVLPEATVYVQEEKGEIKGFIGIVEESYIAGLFVAKPYYSQGIGSALLQKCKQEYPLLRLNVYAKNIKAVNFYKKHGFEIEQEKVNDETEELEYSMLWKR